MSRYRSGVPCPFVCSEYSRKKKTAFRNSVAKGKCFYTRVCVVMCVCCSTESGGEWWGELWRRGEAVEAGETPSGCSPEERGGGGGGEQRGEWGRDRVSDRPLLFTAGL